MDSIKREGSQLWGLCTSQFKKIQNQNTITISSYNFYIYNFFNCNAYYFILSSLVWVIDSHIRPIVRPAVRCPWPNYLNIQPHFFRKSCISIPSQKYPLSPNPCFCLTGCILSVYAYLSISSCRREHRTIGIVLDDVHKSSVLVESLKMKLLIYGIRAYTFDRIICFTVCRAIGISNFKNTDLYHIPFWIWRAVLRREPRCCPHFQRPVGRDEWDCTDLLTYYTSFFINFSFNNLIIIIHFYFLKLWYCKIRRTGSQ